jgi:flagellin-like hook-associated protein FlgL
VENRIQDALTLTAALDTQIRTEIGQKEDADIVSASLELSQGNLQIQAALQMRGGLPRTTLFDFISR